MRIAVIALSVLSIFSSVARAQLPPVPARWDDWSMQVKPDQPGEMSAADLLDKPAGREGGIFCRDGHFYSGSKRVRFWGVNIAFGANFPTHDQADALAKRFARYGINAVRFHHMDNQPFPNGIFADASLTTLSPEALDRLDYFISALKQQGVYADINLHVSRNYNHYHRTADGKDGPKIDKMVDLFDPELIGAQKQYAADLLGHVNAYTHNKYADEPAVGIVEINNENSLFMWGAEQKLLDLPAVYHDELQKQWNAWLAKKYPAREQLALAWNAGAEPLGQNMLVDNAWTDEQHDSAKMSARFGHNGATTSADVNITNVDGTDWHLQVNQPKLNLQKDRHYTVSFDASADRPATITVSVSQAHEPWQGLGLGSDIKLTTEDQSFSLSFVAGDTDANARLIFSVGRQKGTIHLANVTLAPGGGLGLGADEQLGNVQTPSQKMSPSRARREDWYTFLQQTEENYYIGMMNYLKTDIGVKCPITGTIGFGPLGTFGQSKMDFVDAHAYWQHPSFPHRQWDMSDWVINDKAMVDDPQHGELWQLAATRVAGKPFTVTEYQHPAPNDWQAECIPFIATYAALQDWDGVFLFAYSHNADYDKDKISSFFDIEGNPTKMPLMPMGARLFAGIQAATESQQITPLTYAQLLSGVPTYEFNQGEFLRHIGNFDPQTYLSSPISISFNAQQERTAVTHRATWTARGPGTGQFIFGDPTAAVFVGFADAGQAISLSGSDIKVESLSSPFATIIVTPATPGQSIAAADHLLISAIARAQNTNMGWSPNRSSVGNHWGNAPVQIETVQARVSLPGRWGHAYALDANGKATAGDLAEIQGDRTIITLGSAPAICYEVTR